MKKVLGACLAISLLGNAIQFATVDKPKVNDQKTTTTAKNVESVPENVSTDEKEWKLMNAKLASLTASLSEKNDQLDAMQSKLVEQEDKLQSKKGYSRMNHAERLQKMKEENPEEYKKIQERIAAIQEKIAKGTSTRSEFFSNLDTSKLSEQQQKDLQKLNSKMARIDEINRQITDVTPEEQMELKQQFFAEMRGTRQLMDSAREAALGALAQDIGYSGENAKQFTDYIDYVMEMTSMRSMFGGKNGHGGKR